LTLSHLLRHPDHETALGFGQGGWQWPHQCLLLGQGFGG
jgi:hypothetical protein